MAGELCSPTSHQVGHIESTCTTDPHDDTSTFTVPSDCDCLVACVTSWASAWSANPIAGINWDDDGTPQAMTAGVVGFSTNTLFAIYYLLSPTTGQKTLNLDWNAEGVPEETVGLSLVYLKNIDGTGTIVSTDSAYATSGTVSTTSTGTNAQDIAVACAYNYDATPAGFSDAGDGALFLTALTASGTCVDANAASVATDTSGSPFTFGYTSGGNETGVAQVVFKGTSGVTIEVPNGPVW